MRVVLRISCKGPEAELGMFGLRSESELRFRVLTAQRVHLRRNGSGDDRALGLHNQMIPIAAGKQPGGAAE